MGKPSLHVCGDNGLEGMLERGFERLAIGSSLAKAVLILA
jgi:hypothetical protein